MHAYLESYARHFKLFDVIRFNTQATLQFRGDGVDGVRPWKVRVLAANHPDAATDSGGGDAAAPLDFDYAVVACGIFDTPRIPGPDEVQGLSCLDQISGSQAGGWGGANSTFRVLHTQQFRGVSSVLRVPSGKVQTKRQTNTETKTQTTPESKPETRETRQRDNETTPETGAAGDGADKAKVLVVGGAFSGAEVAACLAEGGLDVVVASRTAHYYLPRWLPPPDLDIDCGGIADSSDGKGGSGSADEPPAVPIDLRFYAHPVPPVSSGASTRASAGVRVGAGVVSRA